MEKNTNNNGKPTKNEFTATLGDYSHTGKD